MNRKSEPAGESRVAGDGSMYELLRRSPEVEFDPHIAGAHGGNRGRILRAPGGMPAYRFYSVTDS